MSQLASIELEPSIDHSGLNLEIKAFLTRRAGNAGQRSTFGHILRPLSKVLVRFSFFFKDDRVVGTWTCTEISLTPSLVNENYKILMRRVEEVEEK